jgi:hypothetical protein
MTLPLRLLSRDQLRALRESQLHVVLCRRYHEEVVSVLGPLSQVYASDPNVPLIEVQSLVADRLRSIEGLENEVSNAFAAGGLSLREPELWLALAIWIVENQLDTRPNWDPSKRPRPMPPD